MKSPSRLVILLVMVDLALCAVHVYSAGLTASHLDPAWLIVHPWRVDSDRGFAESFQYLKYLAVAGLALVLATRLGFRSGQLLSVFALFLLADDALRLHETLGGSIAAAFSGGVLGQTLGELLFWPVHGCVFLAYLVVAQRSGPGDERRLAWRVVWLVGLLAVFGAAFDALNGGLVVSAARAVLTDGLGQLTAERVGLLLALPSLPEPLMVAFGALQFQTLLAAEDVGSGLRDLRSLVVALAVVEDGGEMIALSLLVARLRAATRAPAPAS